MTCLLTPFAAYSCFADTGQLVLHKQYMIRTLNIGILFMVKKYVIQSVLDGRVVNDYFERHMQ